MQKILCVAEKNSIAKAVAGHLAGGRLSTANTGNQFIKNYSFNFDFGGELGLCSVLMTSVSGHLTEARFPDDYKNWEYPPPESLFQAPVRVVVDAAKKSIATNITQNARGARAMFIWTDCDREGEHIGGEIRAEALKQNPSLQILRARFSNIEKAHVISAAKNPTRLDDRQVDAVAARIEVDLRIGLAFTRYLTLTLRPICGALSKTLDGKNRVISYGSCQFPTLGFVVDRYFRVKNFTPEPFWGIKVTHRRDNVDVVFNWKRVRLFDRVAVVILFERCLEAKIAEVIKVQEKPTSKWKPLPLTTVELQKMASRLLQMNSHEAMNCAEVLYQKGFISYPRTETDRFDGAINLKSLIEKQVQDNRWGQYSQGLLDGAFTSPRRGRHDDKAHPPIHPVTWVSPANLNAQEGRIYEFITRRFLACCSDDAKGQTTNVDIGYGDEVFGAHGVVVLARNYLEVYPYENWNNSVTLPKFTLGERFEPFEAMIFEGKTTSPGYLTEPELISLMDANGIGTDATMAEHIAKIKERNYVFTRLRRGGGTNTGNENDEGPSRGGNRGRGSRRGRGGRGGSAAPATSRGAMEEFIPSTLGVALIDGYDKMGFEISLSKPFLRKEMELRMKEICEGRLSREEMLRDSIRQYKKVFEQCTEQAEVLKAVCLRLIVRNSEFLIEDINADLNWFIISHSGAIAVVQWNTDKVYGLIMD
ncbi:BgTH12-02839 [Blumeria graminis f. sp. triticale]|uniref:DNA topoisomerase n=1 Tax=Blumeria graminis f. sp. triticale TaxID=1689686 RepID=A0A9W4DNB0_BLUGR|nr:BgTH12-02839 [Blumeria graminis f. sp. triticale]